MKLVPKNGWKKLPHLLKDHGRAVCKPLSECSKCILNRSCPKQGVIKKL